MVRVLTAGHVNWDVTLRVDRLPEADGEASIRSQHQSGGGSAANVAATLAGLSVDTGLIGSVGDDDNGVLARRELEAAGVSIDGVRVVSGADTAVKYLLVDDDGAVSVLGNDGVNEAVGPNDVDPGRIRSVEHVHLTSQHPETATRIAKLATEANITVSFDPGRRVHDREYGPTVAYSDTIFVTDQERAALLEDQHIDSRPEDRIVVVKYGADGARVHTPTASYAHPGFEIDPVDTTGAGDAFAAGFIAVSLESDDVEYALEYANACGALTASHEGARSAPTAEQVGEFLRSQC